MRRIQQIIALIGTLMVMCSICSMPCYAQTNGAPEKPLSLYDYVDPGTLINGFSQKLSIRHGKEIADRTDEEGHLYPTVIDVIVVTNISKSSLYYAAYETPRSSAHIPYDYIEERKDGDWALTEFCFCSEGLSELELKPGESTEFCSEFAHTEPGQQQRRWIVFTDYSRNDPKAVKGHASLTMIEQNPATL